MAISYPLTFPTITGVRRIALRGRSAVARTESAFTFGQQIQAHAGQRWEAEVSLPPMKRASAEEWIAFLLSLNGMEGTFLMGDPNGAAPRGVATGTPVVKGASQTGASLVTDGWTISQTGILKVGDYIQLGSGSSTRLYKVLADANSDGSGNATFDIWPDLRSSPGDNDALTVSSARGLWRLAANEMPWEADWMAFYGITFPCVEAL